MMENMLLTFIDYFADSNGGKAKTKSGSSIESIEEILSLTEEDLDQDRKTLLKKRIIAVILLSFLATSIEITLISWDKNLTLIRMTYRFLSFVSAFALYGMRRQAMDINTLQYVTLTAAILPGLVIFATETAKFWIFVPLSGVSYMIPFGYTWGYFSSNDNRPFMIYSLMMLTSCFYGVTEKATVYITTEEIPLVILSCLVVTSFAYFLNIRDSHRRDMEIQLSLAAIKAKEANQAKTIFISNISHDLRTPIHAFSGSLELLLESNLSVNQREYLSTMQSFCKNLTSVVNNVLDATMIENDQVILKDDLIDVHVMIYQVTNGLAIECLDIDCNIPQQVIGDESCVCQVLTSFFGFITVFVERKPYVRVTAGRQQGSISFTVGRLLPGISEESLSNAFQELFGDLSQRLWKLMNISWKIRRSGGSNIEVREIEITIPFGISEIGSKVTGKPEIRYPPVIHTLNIVKDSVMEKMISQGTKATLKPLTGSEISEKTIPFLLVNNESIDKIKNVRYQLCCYVCSIKGLDAKFPDNVYPLIAPFSMQKFNNFLERFYGVDGKEHELYQDQTIAIPRVTPCPTRILVAEDNDTVSRILSKFLAKKGIYHDIVGNGRVCVEKWANQPPNYYNLILMDVQMPEMDGFQAVHEIRRLEAERNCRTCIIFMSALASSDEVEEGKRVGGDDYLMKPVNFITLSGIIDKITLKESETPSKPFSSH